jgi:disulfide oxidoreductase YuzD
MAMKNTIRVIDAALKAGIVSSRTTNINLLIEIIKPAWRETILSNYYCTDIKFQHSLLSYTDIHNINSQLTDKFDNVALKRINDKYFKMFPLMLMEITASASGKSNLKF